MACKLQDIKYAVSAKAAIGLGSGPRNSLRVFPESAIDRTPDLGINYLAISEMRGSIQITLISGTRHAIAEDARFPKHGVQLPL
jgi:hypothetical protein